MGWSVELLIDGVPVTVPGQYEGSNIQAGGNISADMTVTYNYSKDFGRVMPKGFAQTLTGLTGRASALILALGLAQLGGDHPSENYWASTPGNAAHILAVMLNWATQYPDGIWSIY